MLMNIPVPPRIKTIHSDLKILKRLTIRIDDGNSLFHLNKSETIKQYDLLALEPINERMLNHLNAGRIDFDILTFNQSDSSLFNSIKKANFSLPISKGIAIELNYGHCLVSSTQRRQTLAFGQILVDKTLGKNIILSSGTKSHLKIRSPRDVIYL
ncbi:ribonuclease P-like protein [Sarcoptes scabiei]|uniref:Ribonuclease P-like protein n=1 Tax=Sarcoptes scabiei TaxID=52283 RepID=A0A132AM44_SARSC|nr:ribonuclease P-like protein [Sarcoptes scabiei]